MILQILSYLLISLTAILLGYQLLLHLLALYAKPRVSFDTLIKRRFAIVVPAHNEEKMIASTIYSLFGLLYPKHLYEVFVVADNCSDNTAAISRSLGATVLERFHRQKRGKGFALRWAFDRIHESDKRFDAVVVIDADTLTSGNYLDVMNHYLEQGSEVIQSSDLVLPQKGNWGVESTRIGYLLYNYVKPLGRKVLGLPTGLRGNGMCFRTERLRQIPWEAWSLTEDVEYGLILTFNDVHIDFAPEATVWAHMPAQSTHAESQRSRWETGRFQLMKEYAPKALKKAIRQPSMTFADVFIDLITPPMATLIAWVLFMCGITLILVLTGLLSTLFLILWCTLLLLGIGQFLIGLYAGGADRQLYRAILQTPRYLFWKLRLYSGMIRRTGSSEWVRTSRES